MIRHGERDIDQIRNVLIEHPGETQVLLHFQNSAGRRVTVEAGARYTIKRSAALEEALDRWLLEE